MFDNDGSNESLHLTVLKHLSSLLGHHILVVNPDDTNYYFEDENVIDY